MKNFIIKMVFAIIMLIPFITIVNFVVQFTKQLHCSHETFAQNLPTIKPVSWPKKGLVTLWFADPYVSRGSNDIFKRMDEKRLVAAIGVSHHTTCTYGHLSWKQLNTLQNKGWEITSLLGSNDAGPDEYTPMVFANDLVASKKALRSKGLRAENLVLLEKIDLQGLPDWLGDVKKYYLSALRIKNQLNQLPVMHPYNLKAYVVSSSTKAHEIQEWITTAQQNNSWLILLFYQIGDSRSNYDIDVKQFTRILELIDKAQIPVVLPTQGLGLAGLSHFNIFNEMIPGFFGRQPESIPIAKS